MSGTVYSEGAASFGMFSAVAVVFFSCREEISPTTTVQEGNLFMGKRLKMKTSS